MRNILSVLFLVLVIGAHASTNVRAQSARLHLNTLHSEIEKFKLKKKDFYEITFSDNNPSEMEIRRGAIVKELERSIFKLSKTKPYPNNENLLTSYKNEFDSLLSICKNEMKMVIELKKYSSRSTEDLQHYFDVLSRTEHKLNDAEHRITESESQFFKQNQIKGKFMFSVQADNTKLYELNKEIRTLKLQIIYLDKTIEKNVAPLLSGANSPLELTTRTENTKQAISNFSKLVSKIDNEPLKKLVEHYLEDLEENYITEIKKVTKRLRDTYSPQLVDNTNIDLRYIQLDYSSDHQKFSKKLIAFHLSKLKKMDVI